MSIGFSEALLLLGAMLAADVSIHSDGGGKRPAAVRPVLGRRTVLRLLKALAVRARVDAPAVALDDPLRQLALDTAPQRGRDHRL